MSLDLLQFIDRGNWKISPCRLLPIILESVNIPEFPEFIRDYAKDLGKPRIEKENRPNHCDDKVSSQDLTPFRGWARAAPNMKITSQHLISEIRVLRHAQMLH